MTSRQAEIKNLFLDNFADAKTELIYENLYELLISVMLSAQCTDKRVNIITPALFKMYPSVVELAIAKLDDVKKLINSCSFFNNKAKNLISMANTVIENFGSIIPLSKDELVTLAGVGGKTANVVLIEYNNENLMAVDTHVFRTSHRLRLSSAKTVELTEKDLVRVFKTDLATLHQAMVLFGRYICKAVKPDCGNCFLKHLCTSKDKIEK